MAMRTITIPPASRTVTPRMRRCAERTVVDSLGVHRLVVERDGVPPRDVPICYVGELPFVDDVPDFEWPDGSGQ